METFVLALSLVIASDCSDLKLEPKPQTCESRYEMHYPFAAGLTKDQCQRKLESFRNIYPMEFKGVPFTTTLSMTCN